MTDEEALAKIKAFSIPPPPLTEAELAKIRENVEYVKAKTKEIEDHILVATATERLFESAKEIEDLHISMRVSCDFHKFLLDFGETPSKVEAGYVADTIRGGMDWLYLLGYSCAGMRDDLAQWKVERQATGNFRELRLACLRLFDELLRPTATGGEMLASLLAFIHLELVFMAQTFPSNVDSNLKEDQWQTYRT